MKSPKPVKQNVVEKDAFDELIFESVKEADKISPLCNSLQNEGLTQDVFNSLYKLEPQVTEGTQTAQRGLISQLHKLPEFNQLHAITQLDEISSALGLLQFAPELIEQLEMVQEKIEERNNAMIQDPEVEWPDPSQQPVDLEKLLSEGEMAGLRGTLRRAAEDAQDSAEEWESTASAWGVEKGELQQMPFEKRFELAEQLMNSKKFVGIADLAGRFKNVVNSSSAIVPMHGSDEIVDIGQGDNLSRIVPSELLKLRKTPTLFYKDMLESKLLTYNLKGVENLGKGPLIACLDISDSMNGSREEWAKAVVLSLQNLTEKQKRGFGFIAFESKVVQSGYWAKGNPPTIQDKIEIASVMSNGGTSFYEPLMEAFRMRAKDSQLKPADIVFITDGDCDLNEEELAEIVELKKATEVRIFGIAINDGRYGTDGESLQGFCDQIAVVNSLGEIDVVKQVIVRTASETIKKGGNGQ